MSAAIALWRCYALGVPSSSPQAYPPSRSHFTSCQPILSYVYKGIQQQLQGNLKKTTYFHTALNPGLLF